MLSRIVNQLSFGPGFKDERTGLIVFDKGDTVPTDATAGYEIGCLFVHTDGGAGTAFYINEGTENSCDFNAVAALTAAQEALLGATAGTATASKALILDANKAVDAIRTASLNVGVSGSELPVVLADMTPGTGISGGTNTICEHRVTKVGGLFKTEILIDLTGLNSGDADGDIIGKADTANCHIGQILAAVNGTLVAGKMTCLEAPDGGEPDIDVFSATVATGTEDTLITNLTETALLTAAADWAAGDVKLFTAFPATTEYLYLVASGGATNATYTAGIFLLELWGK